ncbi:hypothetical protein COLO4_36549 [Corchorus olitorius]|uniref:Uncharacterized protein n=1 Tax=Corchorus olitorius TaxID=93759 RepID=A0A1R3G852_9ROSI|nr:hypothetical protein COLO4_36549 [Corchorus olitorius]
MDSEGLNLFDNKSDSGMVYFNGMEEMILKKRMERSKFIRQLAKSILQVYKSKLDGGNLCCVGIGLSYR